MLKNRRHDYRLATQPAEFFVRVLESALQTQPHITEVGDQIANWTAENRTVNYQMFDEKEGPFYFGLSILKEDGLPDESDLRMVRMVFADLVRMDDAARAIPCHHDENEELFTVRIDPECATVVFEYSSTLWNTEWEVHFHIDKKDEWVCLGMPDWKSTGSYIV